jgi:uncharacterized membrane protein
MNLAHLHLLLNHVPTVGFAVGLCLFLVAMIQKDDKLQRVSLGILFAVAVLCIPAYLTGVAASEIMQDVPGISVALMEAHQDAALTAFALMELTGGFAWFALWQFRRYAHAPRPLLVAIVFLSVASFALMAQAANLGGGIRHPEIVSLQATGAVSAPIVNTAWLKTAALRSFVNDTDWVWPACEAVHFIGLGLAFGVVLLLNLRMLGMMKAVAFADLHRTLPWGMMGFAINLVTGMLFFIGVPEQYTNNPSFQWKIACLVLLGANLIYFTSLNDPWRVDAGCDAPRSVKLMAASTIVLWLGVVYFGRMLPYLGGAY